MASPSSPCSRLLGTSTQPSKVHPMLQCRTGLDADGVRRVLGDEGTDSLTSRLGGHQMASVQDQLTILLRAYRTIRFCDACLAMKMGAFPRDVREAVVLIGEGFQISSGKDRRLRSCSLTNFIAVSTGEGLARRCRLGRAKRST